MDAAQTKKNTPIKILISIKSPKKWGKFVSSEVRPEIKIIAAAPIKYLKYFVSFGLNFSTSKNLSAKTEDIKSANDEKQIK